MSSSGSQIGAVGLPLFAAVAEAENLAPVVAAGADAAFGPLLDEAMSGDPGGTEASEPRLTDEKSRQEEQAQPAFLYNVIPVTGFVVFAGAGESQATNCSTFDIAHGARNTNSVPVGTESGNPEEPLPAVPAAGAESAAQPGPLSDGDVRNVVPVQRPSKPNVQEMGPAIGERADQATSGTQGRAPVFEGQGAQTAPATTNDGISPLKPEGARVLDEPVVALPEAVPAATTRQDAQTPPRRAEGPRVLDEPVALLSPEVRPALPGDGAQTVRRRAEGAAQLPDAAPAAATREDVQTAPSQPEGARVWDEPVSPVPDGVPAPATREGVQTMPRQTEGVRVWNEPAAPLSPEVRPAMPGDGAQTVPRRAEGAAQLPDPVPAATTREGPQTPPRCSEGARKWNEPVVPLSPEVHAALPGDGAQTPPRRAEGAAQLPDAVPAAAPREGAQTAPSRSEGARVFNEPVAPVLDAVPVVATREDAQIAPSRSEAARVVDESVAPPSWEVPAAMPSEGVQTAALRPERARFLSKPVAQLPIGASRSAPRNAIRWASAVEGQRAQTVPFRPEGPRGEVFAAMPAEGAQPLPRKTNDAFSPFPSDNPHAMNQPAAQDGIDSAPVFKEQVAQTAPARTNNLPLRPEDARVFGEQAAALSGEVSAAMPGASPSAAEEGIVRSSIRPESARDSGERVAPLPGATVVSSPNNANETDGIARLHPPVIPQSREHAPPSGQRGPDFSDVPAATSAGDSAASATRTDGATELTASAEPHDKNVQGPHPEWQRFVASRYERADIGPSFRRTALAEGPAVVLDVRERNVGTPAPAALEAGLHEGSEVKRNSPIGHGEPAAGSPADGERHDPLPGAILAAGPKPNTHQGDQTPDARPAPAGTQIPELPETQAERAPKAGPVRELNLRLEAVDKPAVRVSLREHAGEIRVAVHSPEAEVRQSLRDGVGGLIDTLEKGGYTAALARPENHPDTRRDGQPDQQQSRGESSPQQQHGDKQHRERNARRWLEQWDQASWK